MYEHMIPIMLEASAALLALSFLAIPMKITSTIEADPLKLNVQQYPPFFRRFCVLAVCRLCFSTSMLFALSMYVILFTTAQDRPFFSSASLVFLGLSGYFLAQRTKFFVWYLLPGQTSEADSANDAIESGLEWRVWKVLALIAPAVSLVLCLLFALVISFEILGVDTRHMWISSLSGMLTGSTISLWMAFVILGLLSVFVDHAFDERTVRRSRRLKAAVKKYAERKFLDFKTGIDEVKSKILALLKNTTVAAPLTSAVPIMFEMKPEQYGLERLLQKSMTVDGALNYLSYELDLITEEHRGAYENFSGENLDELSEQIPSYTARLDKLNFIRKVVGEIERWRSSGTPRRRVRDLPLRPRLSRAAQWQRGSFRRI